MNVLARGKSLQESFVTRKVGDDPQFDLRVVGGKERPAWLRDEGAANLSADLSAHRNVLQVRIGAGETSGRGTGLIERGVQPSRDGIDQLRKCVDIRRLQL